MIGLANNYLVYEISEEFLEKSGILSEFEKVNFNIEDFDIKELLLKTLNDGGVVYGVKESGVLKVVFVFECIKKMKHKKEDKELIFSNAYFTENLSSVLPGFVSVIEESLSEKAALGEFSKIKWNGKEIKKKEHVSLQKSFSSFFACFLLGGCLGVIFDKLPLCLIIGTIIGVFLGSIVRITK